MLSTRSRRVLWTVSALLASSMSPMRFLWLVPYIIVPLVSVLRMRALKFWAYVRAPDVFQFGLWTVGHLLDVSPCLRVAVVS